MNPEEEARELYGHWPNAAHVKTLSWNERQEDCRQAFVNGWGAAAQTYWLDAVRDNTQAAIDI